MASTTRTRRISVRVTERQGATIGEAAATTGDTIARFIVTAAQERAQAILDERRHLVMTEEAFSAFTAGLDAPADVTPEIRELSRLPRINSYG